MDDQEWETPGKRKVLFRVPGGISMILTGATAAFFLQQPLEGTQEENDLAALLGLTIGGGVALLGLLLLVSGVRATRRANRVAAQGVQATGIVTKTKRLGGQGTNGSTGASNYRATIVLDTPVGEVTETVAIGALPPIKGDTVLVRLDPDDASYAVVEGCRRGPLPTTTAPQVLAMRAGQRGVYLRRR